MIDFACKTFELEDVIRCGLNLTRSDYNVMKFLMKISEKELSSVAISKELGLELSTVQRALKKLSEKNIIIRSQKNLSSGGYVFKYTINEKKFVKKTILDIVDGWVKKVHHEIERW